MMLEIAQIKKIQCMKCLRLMFLLLSLNFIIHFSAEVQLPVIGQDSFRSQMDESEKHLENLVKELKEMSQTKYPSYLPNANTHGGEK